MKKLKLVKGLSYFTPAMEKSVVKGKEFEVSDESLFARLLATGRFEEVKDSVEKQESSAGKQESGEAKLPEDLVDEPTEKKIDALNTKQLEAFAALKEIDISECSKNDERKAAIKEALGLVDPFQQ